jgi:maleamate amidohydrolase
VQYAAKPLGFGIRPAVVVVDYENAFTQAGEPFGWDCSAAIASTKQLLDAARGAEVPIFFAVVAYDDSDVAGGSDVWLRKHPSLSALRTGSSAVEVDSRLRRTPSEPLLVKKYASAFFGTTLTSRLNSQAVDTLLFAGCNTGGCVRATVVDAIQYGFFRSGRGDGQRPDPSVARPGPARSRLEVRREIVSLASAVDHLAATSRYASSG